MLPVLNKTIFEYIGLAFTGYLVLKMLYKVLSNLYTFTLGGINLKKYGEWAVVTGCTDGIGYAYAEYVAKRGLNVVLVSRNADKLNELSDKLKSKYKVNTKVIVVNFTEENTIYTEIRQQLQGLDIGVLINNVGVAYEYPEYFHLLKDVEQFANNMIHTNIISMTKLTAIVLPDMVAKKRGIIINVGSAAGRKPLPLNTVYSATKAYCDFFSRTLSADYGPKGIIVQSVNPYFVATKMSKMRRSFIAPSPSEYVASAMKTVGSQEVTNGCLVHNLQGWVIESFLPNWLLQRLSINQMQTVRAKALKKLNAKKE
jgi:17beta-estradiol 17-dehydrogenase / very-long-chain 3-oxoacyl-CoA reductase